MNRRHRRSARRAVLVKLLEIGVTLAFLLIMINLVLPWATQSLSDSFVQQMQTR